MPGRGVGTLPGVSRSLLILLPMALLVGCVGRTLTVTSEPSGALVEVNGEEFGRTPVTRDFTYYGKLDVTLRKEGFEPTKAERWVVAPWWQWPPFDFLAELAPWRPLDRRGLAFTLEPLTDEDADAASLIDRANATRQLLPPAEASEDDGA